MAGFRGKAVRTQSAFRHRLQKLPSTDSTRCKKALGGRKRDAEAGPAKRRGTGRDAAVVKHDDLLHQCQTQAGAASLRREERLKDTRASRGLDARAVVVDAD